MGSAGATGALDCSAIASSSSERRGEGGEWLGRASRPIACSERGSFSFFSLSFPASFNARVTKNVFITASNFLRRTQLLQWVGLRGEARTMCVRRATLLSDGSQSTVALCGDSVVPSRE